MSNYNRAEYAKKMQRQLERAEQKRIERRQFRNRYLNGHYMEASRDVRMNTARLQRYIMSNRCDLPLSEKILLLFELRASDAPFLAANNPEARIRFQRIFSHHVRMWGQGRTAHFVTLAPKQYAVSASLAENRSLFPVQQWVCSEMKGFNFIAIPEVAYYSDDGTGGKTASFHVHLIVFDADERKLRSVEKKLNAKYEALITSAKVMDFERVTEGTLSSVALYMGKESISNYWPAPFEVVLPEVWF